MTSQLPQGWKVDDEEGEEGEKAGALPSGWKVDDEEDSTLPPGWEVEEPKKLTTAKERDDEKLRKLAGSLLPEEKTPEELKKMSVSEKLQYIQDQKAAMELIRSRVIVPNFLSGASFGLTENIPGLEVTEFEETNPYSLIGTGSEIIGSLVPLSRLIKMFSGLSMKLASKSPVLQKQLSSLATMFGVGTTDAALHQIAKGEMPSAEDVLEHGMEWATLDALLQSAGYAGRFAKGLFIKSRNTGLSRIGIINEVNRKIAESGVDMNNAEAVSKLAMEILESPVTKEEMAAAKRIQLPEAEANPITEVAEQTFKQEPITPKDLKTRKIEESEINKLTSQTRELSETYLPEEISFTKEAESLEKDIIQEQIDSVGARAASEEELGTAIREDIEAQLEARKDEYRPLYEKSDEAAKMQLHVPQNTAREVERKLRRISRLSTKPEGYNAVIRYLEAVLKDAGFVIRKNKKGVIKNIVSMKDVPVSDTIELARRLNEIIDYEAVEPTVKDALRSVARAAKADVREALAANADALAAFELAEEAHAETAKRFGADSVRKARGQQAGEKISKMAESPTAMGHFKEVLSPQQFLQLERETLERLNNQPYEKASKTLREVEKHLSSENKKLAREIVEAKNPHNPLARKKLMQNAVLDDMSNAITNGARPEKTLKLWKTPKGQKLIKETFHNSPNWPQVKNYLENQSFNDMVSSVLKDGKIEIKKFKSFMRDPAMVNNIRAQGGEEAVTFFQKLDAQVKRMEEGVKLLDKFPRKQDIEKGQEILRRAKERAKQKPKEVRVGEEAITRGKEQLQETPTGRGKKILERMVEKDFPFIAKSRAWKEWISETMGLTPKAALSVFGLMKLGIPNTVTTLIGYRMMNRMLTSPRIRQAFSEAAKHHSSPLKFILAIDKLGNVFDEEDN